MYKHARGGDNEFDLLIKENQHAALPVEGEVVQLVLHVDGVDVTKLDQLLQSLVYEDDADEGSEGLLCKAGDVADQRAGVSCDQQQAEEGRPQSNTGPQGQVGQTVVTEKTQEWVTSVF